MMIVIKIDNPPSLGILSLWIFLGPSGIFTIVAIFIYKIFIIKYVKNIDVQKITNKKFEFIEGDIRNKQLIKDTLTHFNPDTDMHFAGLKSFGESVMDPLKYYDINVHGIINLL